MAMDWKEQARIWEEAERKANVPYYISNKDNPLRELIEPRDNTFEQNMDTLRRDMRMREKPVIGKIYAGLMDNMRYGGNE